MALLVRSTLRMGSLSLRTLRKDARLLRRILGIARFDVGISCVGRDEMRELNRIYRGKDEATNVLSFPFHEDLSPDSIQLLEDNDDLNLGDIYLGIPVVEEESKEWQMDFHDLLTVLVAHGLCHLIGYDHMTFSDWYQMIKKEDDVLRKFRQQTGRSCYPITAQPIE